MTPDDYEITVRRVRDVVYPAYACPTHGKFWKASPADARWFEAFWNCPQCAEPGMLTGIDFEKSSDA